MWKPLDERWAAFAIWTLIVLSIAERALLLHYFGFTHIGIDDALVQQVAIDMSNGLFREPFLYGQNYNPMLEALLAALFLGSGASPTIVLPMVTSLLALLPFWSWAVWANQRRAVTAAFVLAATPLALPLEWGLITSMPRGWVHGQALLAVIPWLMGVRPVFVRYAMLSSTLVASLLLNPNALPLVTGLSIWLVLRHGRAPWLWITGSLSLGMGWAVQDAARSWYAARPGVVVHPLLPADVSFDPALLSHGISHLDEHLVHMVPFMVNGTIGIVFLLLLAGLIWYNGDRAIGAALIGGLFTMVIALGLPKVHEGCASVFFPLSRMMLAFPLILGLAVALLFRSHLLPRFALVVLPCGALLLPFIVGALPGRIQDQLDKQECAWVREEPLAVVRERCRTIHEAAIRSGCDLIVPVRWPGIKIDHRQHFAAHFTCYACPQLEPGLPPIHGAGYERRSWVRKAHEAPPQGLVLFVGGDPDAWRRAILAGRAIEDLSAHGVNLHAAICDTIAVGDFLLQLGMDDDLGR